MQQHTELKTHAVPRHISLHGFAHLSQAVHHWPRYDISPPVLDYQR